MIEALVTGASVVAAAAGVVAALASYQRAKERSVEDADRQRMEEALVILRRMNNKPQDVQTAINKINKQLNEREKVRL